MMEKNNFPGNGNASPVFELRNIRRNFGTLSAVSNVSFSICAGERILLLGANGSGKSTLLRICCGLLRPDSGSVTRLPGRVAYFGDLSGLYSRLSVEENLILHASSVDGDPDLKLHMEEWGVAQYARRKVCDLSKGQQALVSLARAFLGDPDWIFLDEPTSALDGNVTKRLLAELQAATKRQSSGSIAVIATHDIERLKGFATRYVILSGGQVVYDTSGTTPRELEVVSHYLEAQR